MANMRDFIENTSRVKKFLTLREGADNNTTRDLERKLLKPDKLPPFAGERPARSPIEARTVMMVFETDEDMELFKRFFKVATYKGQNTRDTGLLVNFLEALERGTLQVEEGTLYFVTDQDERIQI